MNSSTAGPAFPKPRGPDARLDIVTQGLLHQDAAHQTTHLPLELIQSHPDLEQRTSYPKVEEMARSLADHGQLQPVGVWEQPDGTYYLVWGYTRVEALRQPGVQQNEVYARVYRDLTIEKARELAFVENFSRQDLSLYDKARQIQRSIDDGWPATAISKLTGLDRRTIGRLQVLAQCAERSEAFREASTRPGFPLRAAEVFRDLEAWSLGEDRLKQILPLLTAEDKPLSIRAFGQQLRSLLSAAKPPHSAPAKAALRPLKTGGFRLSMRVVPGDPDALEEHIVTLKEALKQARKLERQQRQAHAEGDE